MNPIPFPTVLNFAPPPIVGPMGLGIAPPPYTRPPPAILVPAVVPPPPLALPILVPPTLANPPGTSSSPAHAHGPTTHSCGCHSTTSSTTITPTPGSVNSSGVGLDIDNVSLPEASELSIQSLGQEHAPGGRFSLPKLSSLTDTVTYKMWKNTIGFFHLIGRTNKIVMLVAYQPIVGDMAHHIITQGPHLSFPQLIAHLDSTFGVVTDEDMLIKELYTIKQGPQESVICFDTRIGYWMMRLAAMFLEVIPPERSEETKNSQFLVGLRPNLKAAIAGDCAWMAGDAI